MTEPDRRAGVSYQTSLLIRHLFVGAADFFLPIDFLHLVCTSKRFYIPGSTAKAEDALAAEDWLGLIPLHKVVRNPASHSYP